MSPCAKCSHELAEHDVYDGCKHIHHDWLKSRECICSNFQSVERCDCERCVKKDYKQ
jgi:hypothetical protein